MAAAAPAPASEEFGSRIIYGTGLTTSGGLPTLVEVAVVPPKGARERRAARVSLRAAGAEYATARLGGAGQPPIRWAQFFDGVPANDLVEV